MGNKSGIYCIAHTSGKMYIGSAINLYRRRYEHRRHLNQGIHCNKKLQRAWNKYGESAFTFSTLLVCSNENLLMYEQLCIDGYDSVKTGYNISIRAGSQLGFKHSEETKSRMSSRTITEQQRAAISARNSGKKPSLEVREKISLSLLGKKKPLRSKEHAAKIAAALRGRHLPAAHKDKLSAALRGKVRSDDHCANISKSKKGVSKPPHTAEHRARISESLFKHYADKRARLLALENVQ